MQSNLLEGSSCSLCVLRVILVDELVDVPVENLGWVLALDVGAAHGASGVLPLPLFETIGAERVATVESCRIDEHLNF